MARRTVSEAVSDMKSGRMTVAEAFQSLVEMPSLEAPHASTWPDPTAGMGLSDWLRAHYGDEAITQAALAGGATAAVAGTAAAAQRIRNKKAVSRAASSASGS